MVESNLNVAGGPGQGPGGYGGPPGQPGGYGGAPGQPGGYGYGGQPGYGGPPQQPAKKGNGCMIGFAIAGVLVVVVGGGLWFFFHPAFHGDPCMVSGSTITRGCGGDDYCVNPDVLGDGTCMSESEGTIACAHGSLCKEEGKCVFTTGSCTAK